MSERSRDEKLAAAKKKLKKFQENSTKVKNQEETTMNNFKSNKVPQCENVKPAVSEKQYELPKETSIINQSNSVDIVLNIEEPTATTESLKQISRHLNGIISRSSSSIDGESQQESINTIRELEKRNVELASLNSQKAEQLECLNIKVNTLNDNIDKITREYNNEKYHMENSFKKQIESNRSQLQAQIHTISLLVAEKSELQSQLTHNQKLANQRYQENEDLVHKLKASRQKVGDLEKSLNELKLASDKTDEAKRDMSRQLEQTRNDLKKIKLEKDDMLLECSQLRSKLIAKNQEMSNLELTFDDIKSELEMSQVQIQHLTNNQEGHYDNLCVQLKAADNKNADLSKELEIIKSQLHQAESQNINIQTQYRNYFEQMEDRLKAAKIEIHIATEAKNDLYLQLEHMKKDMISNPKNESIDTILHEKMISEIENKCSSLTKKVKVLEQTNSDLNQQVTFLSAIKEELEEKTKDQIAQIKQFELNQVDYAQLLCQLQSDKTALSRALAQNKQLKSQLIELQEAFVKLSSDNMDLSTQLQHEKYVSKELASRLGEQEDELNEIRQMIVTKDEELSKLNHINHQITEELLTFNNTENDSIKRSETHFNMANKVVIENLQNDLINYQERINELTSENNILKHQLDQTSNSSTNVHENKDIQNDIRNLTLNLRQTEAERDELLSKCAVFRIKELDSINYIHKHEKEDEIDLMVSEEEYRSLKKYNLQLHENLQELTTKNELLIKENQRLEHLVGQLEGETDTIAEYINLYQHQRSILKQKCKSRDQLMSKLIHQKQLIDNKLVVLENLFKSISKKEVKDSNPKDDSVEHSVCQISYVHEDQINLSVFEKIFSIIHELQKPNDIVSKQFDNSLIEDKNNKFDVPFDSTLLSDDLFHYHIIHCKCCVGKIIDL